MESWAQTLITIVCTVIASGGFWSYLQARRDKNDFKTQMLVGLGHDRIMFLGTSYIERGYITRDEYDNLYKYLYEPYVKMGGNGSAKRIMDKVERLPIHKPEED